MILQPKAAHAARPAPQAVPIWNAIQAAQMDKPACCVTQADHARLAGEIARNIDPEFFPRLEPSVIEAIALHDEGWHELDSKPPVRSFLDVKPADFLSAWRGSILAAGKVSELGGLMVGGHFSRLAKTRLELAPNAPAEAQLLNEFVHEQDQARQKHSIASSEQHVEELIDLLQFCDVFSLYLCSGAPERVQFPQKLGGTIFQLYRQGEWSVSSPPLFASSIRLQVPAWEVTPKSDKGKPAPLNFLLR